MYVVLRLYCWQDEIAVRHWACDQYIHRCERLCYQILRCCNSPFNPHVVLFAHYCAKGSNLPQTQRLVKLFLSIYLFILIAYLGESKWLIYTLYCLIKRCDRFWLSIPSNLRLPVAIQRIARSWIGGGPQVLEAPMILLSTNVRRTYVNA